MVPPPPKTSHESSSTPSRHRLTRILGLGPDASRRQIDAALPRLLGRLGARLNATGTDEPEQIARLREEIAHLAISRAAIESFPVGTGKPPPKSPPKPFPGREVRFGALMGIGLSVCLLLAYTAGYRIEGPNTDEPAAMATAPAILILDGANPSATLRVFDADREELLLKAPAFGARVEVPPGRLALEVSREDCPDRWTRSVYFEERSIHRFEPRICLGGGQLKIRSNVTGDRLRIDGIDAGSTASKPHLLGVGDHEIQIDKAGYQSFRGIVRISPNATVEIRAELVAGSPDAAQRGRPLPVTKHSPEIAPSKSQDLQPFGLPDLNQTSLGITRTEELIPELTAALSPDLAADLGSAYAFDALDSLDADPFRPPSDTSKYYVAAAAGSTRWHDRVSADMIARYDRDSSGQIDQLSESEAISCRVWRELERDFDAGGLGLSMVRYFGFDGTEWHPNALGFARTHRSAVFEKMKECGLQE
ncbi:MAG TPA: PEGA domain-containing protein [Myxococcales bacterium]|nr:PEGA domain-containing protein [Myxococcales bacterium]HIK86233.1 PEGA domain-containing protein [Myxococcales bacterium]